MKINQKYFINQKTEIRESPITGKGLFAKEKIKKGEIINFTEGKILTLGEYKKLSEKQQDFCYDIDDNHVLCPEDFDNLTPDWFINHSCDSNCGALSDYHSIVAMRNINIGEEIIYDYAMLDFDPGWSMECHCGSVNCRRIITGNDWKNREIQEKYKGFFQKNIKLAFNEII